MHLELRGDGDLHLPADLLRRLGLVGGDLVSVDVEDGAIVLRGTDSAGSSPMASLEGLGLVEALEEERRIERER